MRSEKFLRQNYELKLCEYPPSHWKVGYKVVWCDVTEEIKQSLNVDSRGGARNYKGADSSDDSK